jgi:hypothetical protein
MMKVDTKRKQIPVATKRLLRKFGQLALAAIVFGACVNPSTAWSNSGPLTRTDYNSVSAGSDNYEYWSEQAKAPNRVMYVADPAGERGVVQRVEVRPGDNNVFSSNTGERAEVVRLSGLGGIVDSQTIVMSWSTFIDSDFASPPGGWNNFVQFHVAGGAGQSPWLLNLSGDGAELGIRLIGGGDWNTTKQPPGSVEQWLSLGAQPKGQWSDFVIEVRFGCRGMGYAKVWRNSELLVDVRERKIGYCGDPGLYWKQGFYRSGYGKTTRLWFDDTFRWAKVSDAFDHYGWSAGGADDCSSNPECDHHKPRR